VGPQQRLSAYLATVRNRPFTYHAWDCLMFTNEGWRAMHGRGWADDWLGQYTKNGLYLRPDNLREVFGYQSLEDAIGDRLKKQAFPARGALVISDQIDGAAKRIVGFSMGLCVGTRAAFVGRTGVETITIDRIQGAWA
jgi:uncharacterized protein DUF6950